MKQKSSIFKNIRKFANARHQKANRVIVQSVGMKIIQEPRPKPRKAHCSSGACDVTSQLKRKVKRRTRSIKRRIVDFLPNLSPQTRHVINMAEQLQSPFQGNYDFLKEELGLKQKMRGRVRQLSRNVSAYSIGMIESDTSLLQPSTLATFGKFVQGDDAFNGLQRDILGSQVARATDAYDMSSEGYDYWNDDWHQFDFSDYVDEDDYDDEDEDDDDEEEEEDEPNENCPGCEGCSGCKNCVNCYNCKNCENCQNCSNCTGCKNCTGCMNSKKCNSCSKCNKCKKCSGCKACSKCNKCSGGCSKCKGCSNCKKCSGCSGCSGGCSKCSKCKGCSGCSGCSKCNNCSNCSNCNSADSQSSVSLPCSAAEAAATAAENCQAIMDAVADAMDNGLDSLPTMDSILDAAEDALDMLTSSLQNALEETLPDMMVDIMDQILYSNEDTLPLFEDIFAMTWSENKQWAPTCLESIAEEGQNWLCGFLGGSCSGDCSQSYDDEWMVPKHEIPEYFDYLQLFFGGALANMETCYKDIFDGLVDPISEALDEISEQEAEAQAAAAASASSGSRGLVVQSRDAVAGAVAGAAAAAPAAGDGGAAAAGALAPAAVIASLFGSKPIKTEVPLMSISKQVMDCMNNVCKLNTMIRDCTKELLENLKDLEASELYECCKGGKCNKKKCCGGGGHCNKRKMIKCTACDIELGTCPYKVKWKDEKPYCDDCFAELFGSAESDLVMSSRSVLLSRNTEDGADYSDSSDSSDSDDSEQDDYEDYDDWDDEDDDWEEEEDGICTDDFKQILDVLLQSEFVLSNLATVIGKIMEYFLNKATAEFADKSNQVCMDILKIWHEVCEIVPPLECLLQLLFTVPNDADKCTNCCCNHALPMIWNTVQQFVEPACEAVADISDMCDDATSLQYNQDAMNQLSSNVAIA